MVTIPSARLTISPGSAPHSVVVDVSGALDIEAAGRLERVLDGILNDGDGYAMSVDLHGVCGVDIDGVAALAVVTGRADLRGAEVTLVDPSELLCQALETAGLTGLIRMVRPGRPRAATRIGRRRAQANHPAGRLLVLQGPNPVEPDSI